MTGALALLVAKVSGRHSRQAQLEQLQTTIMAQVREENRDLRVAVAECRKRDEEFIVLKTCLRMMTPEFIRIAPKSPILRQVGGMIIDAFGTPDHSLADVRGMIEKLREEPGTVFDTTEEPRPRPAD